MLTCAEATQAVEQSKFENIGFGKKVSLRVHLWMCKYCRNYKKDSAAIDRMLKKPGAKPPTFTHEEIEAMMKRVKEV